MQTISMPPLNVIVLQRDGVWVAQCLQYDLTAQAEKLTDLPYELDRVLVGHMVIAAEHGEVPFENLDVAPQEYWELFEHASGRYERTQRPPAYRSKPQMLPPPETELRIAAA